MKCKVCKNSVDHEEIYHHWYFCFTCDKDYDLEEDEMPFRSDQQRKYLYSQKPDIAKEFEENTTKKQIKKLPKKVKK